MCWRFLSATGKLVTEKENISQLPLLYKIKPFEATPLWQLLKLDNPFPDPQTWQELNQRTEGIAVSIFYGKSLKCIEKGSDFILEAFVDSRYQIVYWNLQDLPPTENLPAWLELKDLDDEEQEQEEDLCQTN